MTKKRKVLSGQLELNFFTSVQRVAELTTQTEKGTILKGSLDISREFYAALKDDMDYARDESGRTLSREQIADRMSKLIGTKITEGTLYNWTAESHPHTMPADYLPAFIVATGGQRRAVEAISRHSNLYLLPGPEALRAEIERLDEEEKRIRNEKQKRRFYLKELEDR
jgi:hypothetical protein